MLGLLLFLACDRRQCEETRGGPKPADQDSHAARVEGQLQVADHVETKSFGLAPLLSKAGPRLVETWDPYYQRPKRFEAVPLSRLLSRWWPDLNEAPGTELEFAASDGYKVRIPADLASKAFIAFFDVDHPPFEPISERKANPAPLYLIWEGNEWTNLETHPRPWGIVSVRRVSQGVGLEHTQPHAGFGSDVCAQNGHTLFSEQCLRCHAVNQQGGRLGPDLNVPRNVLEYRAEADVRAYIRDPASFRYGSMPAHPHLTEANLDELICYLRVMSRSKNDPRKASATPEKSQ